MESAETSANTRQPDPAADLREATERNAREKHEEEEAARLEKAEADRAAASAQKKLDDAEAALAARWRAEEAAVADRRCSSPHYRLHRRLWSSRGRPGEPAPRTPSRRRRAARPPCWMLSCRRRRLHRRLGGRTANSRWIRRSRRPWTRPKRGCFSKSPRRCVAVLRGRPRRRDLGRSALPARQL